MLGVLSLLLSNRDSFLGGKCCLALGLEILYRVLVILLVLLGTLARAAI